MAAIHVGISLSPSYKANYNFLGSQTLTNPLALLANSMASEIKVEISFPDLASSTNYLTAVAKSRNYEMH